jgi:hypothetical protein
MKLKSSINKPKVSEAVTAAFLALGTAHGLNAKPVFEHGQWWMNCSKCGAQFSAHDANTSTGFGFELVTYGDDYCEEQEIEADRLRKSRR